MGKVYYVSVSITGIIYETLASKKTTVLGLKKMMCAENGLTVHHVCFGKDLPPMNPNGSGVRVGADYMPELADTKNLGSVAGQTWASSSCFTLMTCQKVSTSRF